MKENQTDEPTSPQDPEQLEKWCRQYGRSAMFLFIGYALLGISLAVFTPNDILNQGWARNLISITASVVPAFMDVPARSPIPDVVRFYFGVMWLVLPVLWCGLLYELFKWPASCMSRPKIIEVMKSKTKAIIFYILVVLFALVSFHFAITSLYQPEDGKVTRTLFSSRFSLATGATLFNFGLLLFAVGIVMWPRALYNSWPKLTWFCTRQQKFK